MDRCMKILVANLGSTSFKYRLFNLTDQPGVGGKRELARGGVERIGAASSRVYATLGDEKFDSIQNVPDHAAALEAALGQLSSERGPLQAIEEVAAIGFKAVHGGRVTGVVRVSSEVLEAMEEVSAIAPAHNPPYVRAMRLIQEKFPTIPLIAAFETGFHQTIPDRNALYAVPWEWVEKYGVRRWGFHGASHQFVAQRLESLVSARPLRAISCHLGGSSSVCWLHDGKSVGCSLGMSPQSGLPHNNRVGDFDAFSLVQVARATGRTFDELFAELGTKGGLAGLSGTSGDMRDLEAAVLAGNDRAHIAIDVFVSSIRHWIGAGMVELGGLDAIAFTGGIGENSFRIREQVCQGLDSLGIQMDVAANASNTSEISERNIAERRGSVSLWIVPTNEELVVARQAFDLLISEGRKGV